MAHRSPRELSSREVAVLGALARALLRRDRKLDVDWDDANVLGQLDDYAARLPPPQRTNLTALILGVEGAWLAWNRRPGTSLADAHPDQVVAFMDQWSRHRTYTMRQAFMAVKSLLAFAYVESEAVMAELGMLEEPA